MKFMIKFNSNKADGLSSKVVDGIDSINEYGGFIWFGTIEGGVKYACRNIYIDEIEKVDE